MKSFLAIGVSAVAALCLFWLPGSPASASTLPQCLAQHHVCVAGDGRHAVSQREQNKLEQQYDLSEMTVGILGMAFKAESDDTRSSLSYKLKRLLKFRAAHVLCTDPYAHTDNLCPPTWPSPTRWCGSTRRTGTSRALEDFVTDVQRETTSARSATGAGFLAPAA